MKTPNENPTLGLLICRDKNDTEVQWAFKWINTPLEVATYENIEIKEIQEYMPSTEEIQERIAVAEQEFFVIVREQSGLDSVDSREEEESWVKFQPSSNNPSESQEDCWEAYDTRHLKQYGKRSCKSDRHMRWWKHLVFQFGNNSDKS